MKMGDEKLENAIGKFAPTEQLISEVYVGDLDASMKFLQTCGFSVVRAEPMFAEMKWGENLLFLEQVQDFAELLPSVGHKGLAANIRVMVRDVDFFYEIAKRESHRLIVDIGDRYYGLRDFTVAGPGGIGLRFATSLQSAGH
eukprot:TRINITY_DN25450_c0_g2_i1.p2 TRINITY_DN25450_c0_g2~~TRINITY_DN25450_c0_g2_i1.p2  ORF type:complete len:142 (-),score=29.90 TRINITY_DN25450_c0_g2_i1:88-513(-)